MAGLLVAADFVAPSEGPVAFRRDKVPLDAEAMGNLSHQLQTLAAGLDTSSAADRRGAAQMLALATALDPSNTGARELIANFQNGTHLPNTDAAEIEKCQAKVWQYIGWLETPEAGEQGRALAACLSDVIVVSDPKHPRAEAIRAAGEHGAWAGWVPTVSAYESKALTETESPASNGGKVPARVPEITLINAEIRTPLWQKAAKEDSPKWVLAPAQLKMSAKKTTDAAADATGFSVVVRSAADGGSLPQLGNSIKALLKKQHGKLPAGWTVTITSEELQKSILSGKRQSISAAAAVLASAAVTGREPDATIIGIIDDKGAFTLPTGFCDQLDSLGRGNGGRLVLPAAAAEYLPSLLALEKPQFFLDYEVMLAADFKELLDLTSKTPDEAVGKATAKFQEIRSKAGSQAVGQYVANTFVRRRLAELAQEAPYHYSARMLAIQGAGNRPTQVIRAVLVSELRRAIAPMAWIVSPIDPFANSVESSKVEQLTQTFETCRTQVDHLDRYVAKEDRDLFIHVRDMVAGIRPLERAARARGEEYLVKSSVSTARTGLVRAYEAVVAELVDAPGESDPVPAPTP
jgi:hypothetical protein